MRGDNTTTETDQKEKNPTVLGVLLAACCERGGGGEGEGEGGRGGGGGRERRGDVVRDSRTNKGFRCSRRTGLHQILPSSELLFGKRQRSALLQMSTQTKKQLSPEFIIASIGPALSREFRARIISSNTQSPPSTCKS